MKKLFILVIAFLLFSSTATATTIDTSSGGHGNSFVKYFGESPGRPWGRLWGTILATYGQTFQLNSGDDNLLDSISFFIEDDAGRTAPGGMPHENIEFAFYLYEWDGGKIIGNSLFASSQLATTNQNNFETFLVNTGGVQLSLETDYVWFVSTSNFFNGVAGRGSMGATDGSPDNDYSNGNFVFMNNDSNFGLLSTNDWQQNTVLDLAFTMQLSSAQAPVPEPATIALLGIGLIGLGGIAVRQRFKRVKK